MQGFFADAPLCAVPGRTDSLSCHMAEAGVFRRGEIKY